MSQVLHTMTRNASGLEFPGGLILVPAIHTKGAAAMVPSGREEQPVLSNFCSPQLWLQETCPSSLVQTSPYFFFNSSSCQTEDFQLRGVS